MFPVIGTSPKISYILDMVEIKSFLQKKYLNLFPKVRDISQKEISFVTVKSHVKNKLNLVVATEETVKN